MYKSERAKRTKQIKDWQRRNQQQLSRFGKDRPIRAADISLGQA